MNSRGRKLPLLLCQHQNMLWIEEHPDATRLERIKALAYSLIGTADAPSGSSLSEFGLEEDFEITNEPLETCQAFDEIVMRCAGCDWWCDASLMNGEYCDDCAFDSDRDEEDE